MRTLSLILAFCLVGFTASSSTAAQSSSNLQLPVRGAVLTATLTLPSGTGPHPAVVLLGGSGPSTRQSLKKFSDLMIAQGFATLVFDKRGSGESTGSWTTASFDDNVNDAAAAIGALKKDARIDSRRVGVWGVSQAGWFIPALAVRTPDLAFAIVLTGGGSTPLEVEMFMHEAALERANVPADDRAKGRALLNAYFAWLGTGAGLQNVVDLIAKAKGQSWYAPIAIDGVMPSDENRPNWEWVALYDPMTDIQRMTVPTLVVLGAEDRMGSSTSGEARWKSGLVKAGNRRAAVITIAGMGHAATIGSTHAQGGAVMPEYTTTVATFLAGIK